MDGYNRTRFIQELLELHKSEAPSFTIHLHPEHWTLNSGSRFLYNNQISAFLDDVRAHRIPVDFIETFNESGVRYFEGCLIVDLFDYRPQKPTDSALENPEKTREVLHPTSETLWADICNLSTGVQLTDMQAFEIEARILLATSPPLCLDPDPHLSRIANNVMRVTTPSAPASLKRKASALNVEKDNAGKARKEKIMQYMAPGSPRASKQFRQLEIIQRIREEQRGGAGAGGVPPQHQSQPIPPLSQQPQPQPSIQPRAPSQTPVPPSQVPSYAVSQSSSHQSSPVPPPATFQAVHSPSNTAPDPTRRPVTFVVNPVNGVQTPVPVNANLYHASSPQSSGSSNAHSQAATEVAKRTPTPAQRFSQSPRVSHTQPHLSAQNHAAVSSHSSPPRASPRPPSSQKVHPPQAHPTQAPGANQPVPMIPRPPTAPGVGVPMQTQTFQLQNPPARNTQQKPSAVAPAYFHNYPNYSNFQNQTNWASPQQQLQQQQQQQRLAVAQAQAQAQTQAQGQAQQAVVAGRLTPVNMNANARQATRSPMPSSLTATPNPNANGVPGAPGSVNSPRSGAKVIPPTQNGAQNQPHLAPAPPYQSLKFRVPQQAPIQGQGQGVGQGEKLSPAGHGEAQAQNQTPKLQSQLPPQQQQRRPTPSQVTPTNVQVQPSPRPHSAQPAQQPSQPQQQHGMAYPTMYAYAAQTGYPAQGAQYYAAAAAMRGIIPMQGVQMPVQITHAQRQAQAQMMQLQQQHQQQQSQSHPIQSQMAQHSQGQAAAQHYPMNVNINLMAQQAQALQKVQQQQQQQQQGR